ncbi:6289_t:CDS:2 [Scutellospora calospora]|uniref:6289_t:CDS:1 n=1 Tax=Scutellospora calospora TaxID=85575 RepID=A0ACA9L0I2_9GLOM|nr:6289_t:CDS:2 [Scutellospora calospora]
MAIKTRFLNRVIDKPTTARACCQWQLSKITTHRELPQATVDVSGNISRASRPLSPHISIYQPQLTWFLSGFHRITGGALATVLYGSAIAYVIQGPLGLGLNSDALVAEIATLPTSLKLAGKFFLAFPFTFHSFNGVRHLIWDTGSALTLKGVYTTGYTVLGLSIISTLGLCMI